MMCLLEDVHERLLPSQDHLKHADIWFTTNLSFYCFCQKSDCVLAINKINFRRTIHLHSMFQLLTETKHINIYHHFTQDSE